MKVLATLTLALLSTPLALASCKCACEGPKGTDDQLDQWTEDNCNAKLGDESSACQTDKDYDDGPGLCKAASCCIDTDAFVAACKDAGASGGRCS